MRCTVSQSTPQPFLTKANSRSDGGEHAKPRNRRQAQRFQLLDNSVGVIPWRFKLRISCLTAAPNTRAACSVTALSGCRPPDRWIAKGYVEFIRPVPHQGSRLPRAVIGYAV